MNAGAHVSLGSGGAMEMTQFTVYNSQKDPRTLKTRGTLRIRAAFTLKSPYGIREVRISDSDREVMRIFDGKGAKEFTKEFELVHDKQHYLLLEAVDGKGNKVVSHPVIIYDYKQGFFRCGDNLNILGPLGLILHPDRSEKFPQIKPLRNANLYSYFGEDSGSALCPHPIAQSFNIFYTNNGEAYPSQKFTVENLRMDLQLSSGDLQIGETIIDSLCEKYDNERRPGPAMSSPARIVEEHPWFIHKQRAYSTRDRVDFHVQWDHRRMNESLIDYDGGFQYFEGEVTFKRDITFNQHTYPSIALGRFMIHPQNVSKMFADQIIWIDPEKGLQNVIHEIGKKESMKGAVAENGFLAFMNSKIGYLGIIPVTGQFGFSYSSGRLMYGPLMPGKSYKKGDVVRYAYITGTFSDKARDEKRIAQAAGILRDKTYPNTLKKGTLNKNGFFYDVTAKDHQAEFTLHKAGLGIDLPIRIRGLEDNGCAAAYTSQRPWFRFVGFDTKEKFAYLQEPIDQKNDIWVGNVFLASDKNLKLTLVVDGQDKKKGPFLEIHNPTDILIETRIWSPEGTPVFGGKSFTVKVPAKDSVFCDPDGKLK